ncbi:MAG: tagaturonate epimerase family protein [Candidatus Marinimicrobia bacterium]|nr:tagaturonate epimerase family protein [Candidatus Neomarinimicrobiota bacterium]MCF7827392.1 tagaturonate epimerase family protein [Candidatus Neomarinimicrobiota bacterium]MCF7881375.1 tagaturonate epimerase family protein [Candidatus Neomarinimicrobiota bacterium]
MAEKLSLNLLKSIADDGVDNATRTRVALEDDAEWEIYPKSVNTLEGSYWFIARDGKVKALWFASPEDEPAIVGEYEGEQIATDADDISSLKKCPLSHANAEIMREQYDYTSPQLIGINNSYGLGDRLGIANPAHLRAIQITDLKPVLAQQSIREMERTNRTPDEVMDVATWSVLQEGYTGGFGSDADHLKTPEDIDYTIAAGFTMFTIDPGDHVNNEADTLPVATLEQEVQGLNWTELEDDYESAITRYSDKTIEVDSTFSLNPSREDTLRAFTKYGKVIAHTKKMVRYLEENYPEHPSEIELSVDETESVTQPFEHYLVVNELRRLGVELVSLAPRFVGRFEKGIDYIGDLDEFREEYKKHLKIAEKHGPYKLSVHSGSDKFSVYEVVGSLDMGHVHVKTAGTSYLEALRAIAKVKPDLFREIWDFSREIYDTEKRSYHVSANVNKVPAGDECSDDELVALFEDEQVDARQVMHVCFGRVLSEKTDSGDYQFRDKILDTLEEYEDVHYETLMSHFARHFEPLTSK